MATETKQTCPECGEALVHQRECVEEAWWVPCPVTIKRSWDGKSHFFECDCGGTGKVRVPGRWEIVTRCLRCGTSERAAADVEARVEDRPRMPGWKDRWGYGRYGR